MTRWLPLSVAGAPGACILALGLWRDNSAFLAPARIVLFVLAAAVYLLPTVLAVYRDCRSTPWIAALNVLLGWTIFGWFISIGWAASGKTRSLPPPAPVTSVHPAAGV